MTHPKAADVLAALTEAGVPANLAEYVDPAKLLDGAGEVDADKVTDAAAAYAPPSRWSETGGGKRRGRPLEPSSDAEAGRAAARARFGGDAA